MTAPASKKQKTSHSPEIVAFSSPGQAPDVRLNVLGIKEFHVHCFLLKHHSAFFRKFLDSPGKKGADGTGRNHGEASTAVEKRAGQATSFRYEWVSQFDEDGKGWHLVCGTRAQVSSLNSFNSMPYLPSEPLPKSSLSAMLTFDFRYQNLI
jgi:hypothetical protein